MSTQPQSVAVRHNFETAHRLPFLGGKCQNLHGHSWYVEVTVGGVPDDDGVLIEFAALKAALRAWIDENLDHGAMLGEADPLVPVLQDSGSKVFVFRPGIGKGLTGSGLNLRGLAWPSVENVAELLRRVTLGILVDTGQPVGFLTVHTRVTETAVNAATAGVLP